MGLKTALENFSLCKILSEKDGTNKLLEELKKLANSFLCGGYISVKDGNGKEVYRIFLHTIEYYLHPEEGCVIPNENKIQDDIMYHRNGKGIEGDYPYLPIMSLHAHDSGYDIAFENEKEKYRASALIREYVVVDMKNKCFLVWDKKTKEEEGQKFIPYKEDRENNSSPVNNQSTYLKKLLTGFSLEEQGYHPVWVDIKCKGKVADKGNRRKGIREDHYPTSYNHEWQFSKESKVYSIEDYLK